VAATGRQQHPRHSSAAARPPPWPEKATGAAAVSAPAAAFSAAVPASVASAPAPDAPGRTRRVQAHECLELRDRGACGSPGVPQGDRPAAVVQHPGCWVPRQLAHARLLQRAVYVLGERAAAVAVSRRAELDDVAVVVAERDTGRGGGR
jgi:hypothetical protein